MSSTNLCENKSLQKLTHAFEGKNMSTDNQIVKTVGAIKFTKGKNGQWYQAKKNRRWDRSDSSYKIIVQMKTVLEKKMITIPIANILKKSFEQVMINNSGELVEMHTNFKDTVFLFLKLHRKFSPATVVSTLKSTSSREVKELVQGLARGQGVYGKAYWGSGYEIYTDFSDLDIEGFQHFKPK